ncbi:MAG: cob(I)yrinic acid a,c-diamide adenosyltransferase [Chitinivibrionales bacterium]|nr:cob(I)yrinic acid a,c-diamide adenosyltransferase [Chitinivibrionales bacterium]
MSISTKTGDSGQTSLRTGQRVWKDSVRVEAYGTIDELSCHIGESRHCVKNPHADQLLHEIQKTLYRAAAELATAEGIFDRAISAEEVETLTDTVHLYEEKIKLTGFIIPGTTVQSAKLDVCRTICRRAERRIITLSHTETVSPVLLQYINRLSDCLFILARYEEFTEGTLEYAKKT